MLLQVGLQLGIRRRLLLNETLVNAKSKLVPVLEYDGLPVTARRIAAVMRSYIRDAKVTPIAGREAAEETES